MRPMSLERVLCILLGICFITCLFLSYYTVSEADQPDTSLIFQNRRSHHGEMQREASRVKVSPAPLLRNYEEDLRVLQKKTQMKERMIQNLNLKKLQLEQEVARLMELLKQHAENEKKQAKPELRALQTKMEAEEKKSLKREEKIKGLSSDKLAREEAHLNDLLKQAEEKKQVKSDDHSEDSENCPLPPTDGYPACTAKIKWMTEMWTTDPCYRGYGVNGSLCSIIIYLSEVESWCPLLPGRVIPTASKQSPENEQAVIRESLRGLDPMLESRIQYKWIHQRIQSMEAIWVEAGRSLSAKYNLTGRKAKQILVHPGLVSDEIGMAKSAFSGGPLGELVQWSDLISSLHILGHHLHLSASVTDLKILFGDIRSGCPPTSPVEPDLIYTDIHGLHQMQKELPESLSKHECIIRVLDSFGTEPDFNHAAWAKKHNLHSPYGGLNLIPMQFYTMFPHTPDNTFLGFVVQPHLSAKENERLQSISRKKQALVYGKSAKFWQGKTAYLDTIQKHMEIHGTVDNSALIPSYVINHGIVKGTDVHALLRQSKVFVGLSFPYEGPAPLEALANGCAFLNPRLHPPKSRLNLEFFKEKPNIREVTSQNPYAEAIGEPYVWTVDMDNSTDVERALNAIIHQTIEPYIPYEFTCEGMLQRLNVLIEKQNLCSSTLSWPPLSSLQVVKADINTSCTQACKKEGLICEPAFFPHINTPQSLANYGVDCQTLELSDGYLVLPSYSNTTKHCVFQADRLLFSCVRSHQSWIRVCPCRDYIKDQIALCNTCI